MNYPELKILSVLFMIVLFVWSVFWIVYAARHLRTSTRNKIYWQTHIIWSLFNTIIAGYSLITTAQIDSFTSDRATPLRNIVAINIILDVVYIVVALMLKKSKNTNKQDVGQAVLIQGLFLLLLDTVIVVTFIAVMTK